MPTVIIGDNTGDDYVGVVDNRIDSTYYPNRNNGAHTRGYTGSDGSRTLRELQRWNLVDISASAICDSAVMSLYDTNWANRTLDCVIDIYEITAANGDWVEGTAIDVEQTDSPCWNYKKYATVNWAGSAGLSTAGTDYVNTVLGSATFTDGVGGYRTITFNANGRTVLQGWFGDATNNGLILFGSTGSSPWTEWHSRQGTDGNRPYLTVGYSTGSKFPIPHLWWSEA